MCWTRAGFLVSLGSWWAGTLGRSLWCFLGALGTSRPVLGLHPGTPCCLWSPGSKKPWYLWALEGQTKKDLSWAPCGLCCMVVRHGKMSPVLFCTFGCLVADSEKTTLGLLRGSGCLKVRPGKIFPGLLSDAACFMARLENLPGMISPETLDFFVGASYQGLGRTSWENFPWTPWFSWIPHDQAQEDLPWEDLPWTAWCLWVP